MRAIFLLIATLVSAAPSLPEARKLVSSKAWEELYLAFSTVKPGSYSLRDRAELSAGMCEGGTALLEADPVMAYSLAERATAFEATPKSMLLLAQAARASDQSDAAEKTLRQAIAAFPRAHEFRLMLGKWLLADHDARGAADVLAQIPGDAKEAGWAGPLLKQARETLKAEELARTQARAMERRVSGETKSGSAVSPLSGLSYESGEGPAGLRTRSNRLFRFKYFKGERDFGQRAQYEGNVAEALNTAHAFTRQILGETREAPVDVVLYSKEEFETHFGGINAMTIAGFYSDNAIRMNNSAELNGKNRSVIVHEYVHAVIDDFAKRNPSVPMWLHEGLAEYVQGRFEGNDGLSAASRGGLRSALKNGQVPRLEQMTDRSVILQANPAVAYAYSAWVVRVMLRTGGTPNLLGLVRDLGAGKPFQTAFGARYGRSVEALDRDARSDL